MSDNHWKLVAQFLRDSRERILAARCVAFNVRDINATRASIALGAPCFAEDIPVPYRGTIAGEIEGRLTCIAMRSMWR